LNILREDWSPVLGIGAVLFGLLHLFLEPAAGEPLNQEAGRLLAEDPAAFARLARQSFMH
jgi:ubiquitin-protein ligase